MRHTQIQIGDQCWLGTLSWPTATASGASYDGLMLYFASFCPFLFFLSSVEMSCSSLSLTFVCPAVKLGHMSPCVAASAFRVAFRIKPCSQALCKGYARRRSHQAQRRAHFSFDKNGRVASKSNPSMRYSAFQRCFATG